MEAIELLGFATAADRRCGMATMPAGCRAPIAIRSTACSRRRRAPKVLRLVSCDPAFEALGVKTFW